MISNRNKKFWSKGNLLVDNLVWLFWAVAFAMAFPTYNLSFTVWFAFIPVLVFACIRPVSTTVKYAFFYSMLHTFLSIFWIFGFWWGGLFFMAVIYALYYSLFFFAIAVVSKRLKELRWIITPMLWVGLELIRSVGYHAFEWNLVGHSQWNHPLLIQSADLLGVWGITFLVLLVNSVAAEVIVQTVEKKFFQKAIMENLSKIVTVALLVLANLVYGVIQLRHYDKVSADSPKERLALIQPNIDSHEDWWKKHWEIYGILWKLNAEAAVQHPDMIVWSETMVRNYVWYYLERWSPEEDVCRFNQRFVDMPAEFDTPIFFTSPTTPDGVHNYNTGEYLDPRGGPRQGNAKIHLVPFGEWMPVYDTWPLFKDVMKYYGAGAYTPSTNFEVIQGRNSRFRMLVCYEDAFAGLARIFIRKGVNYYINSTNDGWAEAFGFRHPLWQHLSCAVLTAVSVRRPIARAANTGYTGIVDLTGRYKGNVADYGRGVYVDDVSVIPEDIVTFYTDYGYMFPYAVFLIAFGAFLFAVFFRKEELEEKKR